MKKPNKPIVSILVLIAIVSISLIMAGCVGDTGESTKAEEPPTIEVIYPNGGEEIESGNPFLVKVICSDPEQINSLHISVLGSKYAGTTTKGISILLPNQTLGETEAYARWNTSDRDTYQPGDMYKVVAKIAYKGNFISDESDGYFSLV